MNFNVKGKNEEGKIKLLKMDPFFLIVFIVLGFAIFGTVWFAYDVGFNNGYITCQEEEKPITSFYETNFSDLSYAKMNLLNVSFEHVDLQPKS